MSSPTIIQRKTRPIDAAMLRRGGPYRDICVSGTGGTAGVPFVVARLTPLFSVVLMKEIAERRWVEDS